MRAYRNPFCSARVRPGAIRYVHSDGRTTSQLVQALIQQDHWGEIVGPHGSGKSSLVRELVPCLDTRNLTSRTIVLHCRPKRMSKLLGHARAEHPRNSSKECDVLIVDGAEQLSRWQRWWLIRSCRQRAMGLLVTSHRSLGLPTLVTTQVSVNLTRQIVRQLLRTWPPSRSWPEAQLTRWLDRVDPLVARHQGNLREVLFTLYDQFLWDERVAGRG